MNGKRVIIVIFHKKHYYWSLKIVVLFLYFISYEMMCWCCFGDCWWVNYWFVWWLAGGSLLGDDWSCYMMMVSFVDCIFCGATVYVISKLVWVNGFVHLFGWTFKALARCLIDRNHTFANKNQIQNTQSLQFHYAKISILQSPVTYRITQKCLHLIFSGFDEPIQQLLTELDNTL